jgi:phosphatidylglycerophosphate synthase/putative flippase GtrA
VLDTLMAWIMGDLSPSARIWTALGPALLACAYFILGLLAFVVRCAIKGVPQDEETLKRGSTVLVGMFLRHYFFWVTQPLWKIIYRSGLPANALSMLSGLLGVSSGVAVAAGRFTLGGWLFLGSGILDVMDGRIARVRKTASPAGAALDSVLDRYADSAILIGLGWYYRDTWVLLPVLAAFMGTSLVPYVRARGEGLGIPLRGGAMQRLERVLFLGGGVALAPILEAIAFPTDERPMHWLAVVGLSVVAIGSNITAMTRLRDLIRALAPPPKVLRRSSGMLLVLSMVGAVLATMVDNGAMTALVELAKLNVTLATALGCAVGAVVNYTFNRFVTFRSDGAVAPQLARYALVSTVSMLLNAGGVALLLMHPQLHYQLAWWLVRGAVYLAWNFPLQRDYVFGDSAGNDDPLLPPRPHAA